MEHSPRTGIGSSTAASGAQVNSWYQVTDKDRRTASPTVTGRHRSPLSREDIREYSRAESPADAATASENTGDGARMTKAVIAGINTAAEMSLFTRFDKAYRATKAVRKTWPDLSPVTRIHSCVIGSIRSNPMNTIVIIETTSREETDPVD